LAENSSLLIGAAIGFISAVVSPIVIEPVKRLLFSPRFKLKFKKNDKGFITDTRVGRSDAHYVRVRVRIKRYGIAKQCRAYLVNVEKWNASTEKFEPTIYCDSLQLAWSAQEDPTEPGTAYRALDIPKGVPQFIDIVSTMRGATTYRVMTKFYLNRYIALFEEHGKFRYTVLVSGDNAKPKSIKIIFEWKGDWDNLTATAGK